MTNAEILLSLIGNHYHLVGDGRYRKTVEHDSLVIDLERGMFFWNSRGIQGTPFDWLTKVENYSDKMAKKFLEKFSGSVTVTEQKEIEKEDVDIDADLVDYFYYNGKYNRDYWYRRGFTDETIEMFKLGYYDGWYTIPIYVDGRLKNISMRRDFPEKRIRSFKKGVGPLPFNFDIIKYFSTVYFVEGPTDVISMVQNGLPAICTNSGTHYFNDEWLKYFSNVKNIYILFDNDEAGYSGAVYMAKKLGEARTKIYCFWGFEEKFDPNDFFAKGYGTKKDLLDLIEKESVFTYEIASRI